MENIIKLNVETMTETEKTILLGIILKNGGLVIEGDSVQKEESKFEEKEGKSETSSMKPESNTETSNDLDCSEKRSESILRIENLRAEGKSHQQIRKKMHLSMEEYCRILGTTPEEFMAEAIRKGSKKRLRTMEKKRKSMKKEIEKHSKYLSGTLNDSEVAKLIGVSPATVGKYKKELLAEKAA